MSDGGSDKMLRRKRPGLRQQPVANHSQYETVACAANDLGKKAEQI